jgi:hypothetical protein
MVDEKKIRSMDPPRGKALVYITRSELIGFAVNMKLRVNGKHVATTNGRNYICLILDPNTYVIESICDNFSKLKLEIKANTKYFLAQKLKPGGWKGITSLELVDEKIGYKRLKKCSLIKSESSDTFPSLGEYESKKLEYLEEEFVSLDKSLSYSLIVMYFILYLGGFVSTIFGFYFFETYPEAHSWGIISIIFQYFFIIMGLSVIIGTSGGVMYMLVATVLGKRKSKRN